MWGGKTPIFFAGKRGLRKGKTYTYFKTQNNIEKEKKEDREKEWQEEGEKNDFTVCKC